jgi:hypothetical protein
VHSDGLGQNFYDCVALNTHNAAQAMEACIAYAGTAANCSDLWTCPMYSGTTFVCEGAGGTTCDTSCWAYGGTISGNVTSCGGCNIKQGTWN